MNRLIALLSIEKNLTLPRLKQVYRLLCRKTHPDSRSGSGERFIALRREYEEALEILTQRDIPPQEQDRQPGPKDPRRDVLELLYLHAIKYYGSDSPRILEQLTAAAARYRKDIADCLKTYDKVLFRHFHLWRGRGDVFYTHGLFIACIKQLFYYYAFSLPRYRTLLLAYLGDLEKRLGKLEPEQRDVLRSLGNWLREAADGEKINVL